MTVIDSATVRGRTTIVSCGKDGHLATWDWATGEPAGPVATHPARIAGLLIHPSATGPIAVTGCADGFIRGWDLTTGALITQTALPAPAHPEAFLDHDLLAIANGTLIRLPNWIAP